MKIKFIIVLLLVMTFSVSGQKYVSILTYNMALPDGNLSDFSSPFSFSGFGIEGRKFVDKDFSFGGKLGWNLFNEKSTKLITGSNWAVSGTNIRNVNSFPMLVNMHYYLGKRRGTRIYFGLNTGLYYITQRFQIGTLELFNDNWHFGLTPEIGVIIPFDDFAVTFNIDYNYAFDAGTSVTGNEDNSYSYIGFNVGFAWYRRWQYYALIERISAVIYKNLIRKFDEFNSNIIDV